MKLPNRLFIALSAVALLTVVPTSSVLTVALRKELVARTKASGLMVVASLSRLIENTQSLHQRVEQSIDGQSLAAATTIAELVAIATAAGEPPATTQRRLDRIVATTHLGQINVTDAQGCAYLNTNRNLKRAFCFSPDPAKQPQAHVFWPLLRGDVQQVVQPVRRRETDNRAFKYAAVAGRDQPRIVQVGYSAELLTQLQDQLGLQRILDDLLRTEGILGIWTVGPDGTPQATALKPGSHLEWDLSPERPRFLQYALDTQSTVTREWGQTLEVSSPLWDRNQKVLGAVTVSLSLEAVDVALRRQVALALAATVAAIALAALVSFRLSRVLVQPVIQLNAATQSLSSRDWKQSLPLDRDDEIGDLARAFEAMAARLHHTFDTLEQRVAERTQDLEIASGEIAALNQRLAQENDRLGAELDVLRRLQQLILPNEEELAAIPELDIAAYMKPADRVGGDYYDVLHRNGAVEIGIGDVTGHGLESGMVMLMAQAAVRTLLTVGETDPVKTMDVLNRVIYDNTRRMRSLKNMTLSLLSYRAGRLRLFGQHEEAIVVRRDGQLERFDTLDLGFPLGLEEDVTAFVAELEIDLWEGDVLVLYTDGVTETTNAAGRLYGPDRLCERVVEHRHGTAREICDAVIEDLHTYGVGGIADDDITLVVLKRDRAGTRSPTGTATHPEADGAIAAGIT